MKLMMSLKSIILEQENPTSVDSDYSKSIGRISPFNISPSATAAAMRSALEKYNKDYQTLGGRNNFVLPGVSIESVKYKPESIERFMQWYSDVIQNPDSVTFRGKAFEGLIAGIFGGEVTNNERTERENKTDVKVGDENLSIKFNEKFSPNGSIPLGGVASSFDRFFKDPDNRKKYSAIKFPKRIMRDNLEDVLYEISNMGDKEEAKRLLRTILNNDDSFGPIDWFVFSTLGNKNEIKVYQYRKEDIINQIVDEVMSDNSNLNNGMLGVKNLAQVPTESFIIKFPQYLKNLQRYKYEIKKDTPTEDGTQFVIKDDKGDVVGVIKKELGKDKVGNNIYHYNLTKLNKYANISKEMELEAKNKFVLFDINRIEQKLEKLMDERSDIRGQGSHRMKKDLDVKIDKVSQILTNLKTMSRELNRRLVNEKNKIYKSGVEQNIQKMFGARGESMSPFIIQQIRKNPDRFFKTFLQIYKDNPKRMRNMEKIFQQVKDNSQTFE